MQSATLVCRRLRRDDPSSEVLKKIVTEDLTPSAGLRFCAYTHVTFGLTPGTRLGVDDVNAQIGVGGMGEVYRATDTILKRSLVIATTTSTLTTSTAFSVGTISSMVLTRLWIA